MLKKYKASLPPKIQRKNKKKNEAEHHTYSTAERKELVSVQVKEYNREIKKELTNPFECLFMPLRGKNAYKTCHRRCNSSKRCYRHKHREVSRIPNELKLKWDLSSIHEREVVSHLLREKHNDTQHIDKLRIGVLGFRGPRTPPPRRYSRATSET